MAGCARRCSCEGCCLRWDAGDSFAAADSFDWSSLSEEGVALTQELAEKSGKFFDEFEWYMRAMKAERAKGAPS
jgi:hypothetical protein